ncbi:MAG: T9SS type A sorting domain-containing protein [Ignavibacteria bacterium]|nr:T9SS type A sorting domain-containing protein [Ignavibacteria bacterium]
MKKYFILIFCALLFIGSASFSQVSPIASIRINDANGVPLMLNQSVTITGIVTAKFGTVQSFIQDNTAGMCIYDSPFTSGVSLGDSVIVTGTLIHYQGLSELQPVSNFTVVGSGKTVNPIVITLQQFVNQTWNGMEEYESRLLRVNGVTFAASGNFAGNTNYTISDATGTYNNALRISNTTNLVGTLIPSGPCDIIGIGSQYVTSPPYSTGYQYMPRSTSDIITSGPSINSVPLESNIQQTSVTLSWTTLSPGDTKVKYFISDSLYQPEIYTDSVYNPAQVTNHSVDLSNLVPGRIYQAMISSTNANGTSVYSPKFFTTLSHSSSTGKIDIYFNLSVDSSVAFPGNVAQGNIDLKTRLMQRIDSAQYSIDIAIYSFNDITILRDKLINAFSRGVKIRIVYDHRDGNIQTLMQDLINAGIRVQMRPLGTYIMHNKFIIFDSRDTSSYSDDWLWTGSANITNQQFYTDAQNVLFIQDESLCKIFTREFEEMWGSHSDYNNPSLAKFGTSKSDNTPHITYVGGKKFEIYFAPSEDISTKLENLILNETHKSINFCILIFTRFNIANRMKTKYNPPNVMVRGVFDSQNSNENLYKEMKGIGGTYPWNPPARVYLESFTGLLHHKYMTIDPEMPSSNPVVATGSYNYTNSATLGNDEGIIFIYDSLIANLYFQEFAKRITDAGGSVGIENIANEIPSGYMLEQNYPNPFNTVTKIEFDIPVSENVTLVIYDGLGREVKRIVNQFLMPGKYAVNFSAENLSSGIYYYKMTSGNFQKVKKMILLK